MARPELPRVCRRRSPQRARGTAYEAAVDADKVRYLEALRGYMKAGRNVALEIRKGAA